MVFASQTTDQDSKQKIRKLSNSLKPMCSSDTTGELCPSVQVVRIVKGKPCFVHVLSDSGAHNDRSPQSGDIVPLPSLKTVSVVIFAVIIVAVSAIIKTAEITLFINQSYQKTKETRVKCSSDCIYHKFESNY